MTIYKAHIFKRRQLGEREEVRIKLFTSDGTPIVLDGPPDVPDAPAWAQWEFPPGTTLLDDGHTEERFDLTGFDPSLYRSFGGIYIDGNSRIVTPTPGVFRVDGQICVGGDVTEGELLEIYAKIEGFPALQRVRLAKHYTTAEDVNTGAYITFNGIVAIDEDNQGPINLSISKGVVWPGTGWFEIVNLHVEQIVGDGSFV